MKKSRHIEPPIKVSIAAYCKTMFALKYVLLFLYSGLMPWYLRGRFFTSSFPNSVCTRALTVNPMTLMTSTAKKQAQAAMRMGI